MDYTVNKVSLNQQKQGNQQNQQKPRTAKKKDKKEEKKVLSFEVYFNGKPYYGHDIKQELVDFRV